MKDKKKNLYILILLSLIVLSACGNTDSRINTENPDDKLAEETNGAVIREIESEGNKTIRETVSENRIVDLTDYSAYLKKVWIVDGWVEETEGWDFPISLVFTKIERGYVEGYFYIEGMIVVNYFRILKNPNMPQFQGIIYDGTVECEYDNDDGGKGTFSLTFCEDDWIEVWLEEDENQCYLLRPYNISDEELRDNQMFYEVELDSWGTVVLFSANSESNHSIPLIFLINEQGDILYEFSAGYQNDSEVLEIIVEDMNEDGLKDVEVVTYFSDMPDVYRFEWYFYQEEDGFFNFGLSKMLGV